MQWHMTMAYANDILSWHNFMTYMMTYTLMTYVNDISFERKGICHCFLHKMSPRCRVKTICHCICHWGGGGVINACHYMCHCICHFMLWCVTCRPNDTWRLHIPMTYQFLICHQKCTWWHMGICHYYMSLNIFLYRCSPSNEHEICCWFFVSLQHNQQGHKQRQNSIVSSCT